MKSEKTKEVDVYAVILITTLLPFGYTVKACGACTLVQSTNGKYSIDYDSFFRIIRLALPARWLP